MKPTSTREFPGSSNHGPGSGRPDRRFEPMENMSSVVTRILTLALLFTAVCGAQAADADGQPEYVLGAGDLIKVSVFQNPDLTVETRVAESGSITFPLIGAVPVGGLSIQAVEQAIARMLRDGGFVLQPQVNALVLQYSSRQVSVLGLVNRPGKYALELASSRLTDVLALVGGITPGGADTLVVVGTREGKPYHAEIDIPAMLLNGDMSNNIMVRGGDIIYVHRAPQFYVYGEVQRPGAYRIERDMTVMQALAQSGGLTPRGTERGIRVHRRGQDGKLERIEPGMDDAVRAEDVIYVRESLF